MASLIITIMTFAVICTVFFMELKSMKRKELLEEEIDDLYKQMSEHYKIMAEFREKLTAMGIRLEVLENEMEAGNALDTSATVDWQRGMENIMNYTVESMFGKGGDST